METVLQKGDIKSAELSVSYFLKQLGYFRIESVQRPRKADAFIIADGERRNIVIKVQVVSAENNTEKLSASEKRSLLSKAEKENREAWIAKIELNEKHELENSISWEIVASR